jgi:hypothetical protein
MIVQSTLAKDDPKKKDGLSKTDTFLNMPQNQYNEYRIELTMVIFYKLFKIIYLKYL